MKVIVFDTETTRLLLPSSAPLEDQPRIVELGLLIAENNKMVATYNWLINPGIPIPAEASKVSGITDEDLAGKPSFEELLPEIKAAFATAPDLGIAHNAPFDVGMLKNELKRCGCEDFPWPNEIVCTVQEYTRQFGRRPKLIQLYEKIMGKPLAQTHRALDDASALFEIVVKDGLLDKLA